MKNEKNEDLNNESSGPENGGEGIIGQLSDVIVPENEPVLSVESDETASDSDGNEHEDYEPDEYLDDGLDETSSEQEEEEPVIEIPGSPLDKHEGLQPSVYDQYFRLKEFLASVSKKDGIRLVDDIDIVFFDDDEFRYTICFEAKRFTSPLDVRSYFVNHNFSVFVVRNKSFEFNHMLNGCLRKKNFFEVTLEGDSKFFTEKCLPPQEEELKGFVKVNKVALWIFIGIMAAFGLLSLFGGKSKEVAKTKYPYDAVSTSGCSEFVSDLDLVMPKPERYDLMFETAEGIRSFINADYELRDGWYFVTSYDEFGDAFRWDEFSRQNVSGITKTRHQNDEGLKDEIQPDALKEREE